MPLRAALLLLCLAVFLATTFARAEDCVCPVIECDPCQKKLFLGPDLKQCSVGAIECQKFVCENVDNYFQCVAGAAPLYIPPSDPALRYSEPRFTPKDPSLLAEDSGPAADPLADTRFDIESQDLPLISASDRGPASVKKTDGEASALLARPGQPSPLAESLREKWKVSMTRLSGQISASGKKNAIQAFSFSSKTLFTAQQKSKIKLTRQKEVIEVELTKSSALGVEVQDGVIVVEVTRGEARFQVLSSRDLVVADMGEWRFGKSSGAFELKADGKVMTVNNQSGGGYLRREALIATATPVASGQIYQFQAGLELFTDLTPQIATKTKNYALSDSGKTPASGSVKMNGNRDVASDALCGAPPGQFEQCAWKCFGAKAKAKSCDSLKTNAKCVRFTCAADGQWKLPTIVSEDECTSDRVHVGLCN